MGKKEKISLEDSKVWSNYTEQMNDVYDKDQQSETKNSQSSKIRIIDLHGLSLVEANKEVKNFIYDSIKKKYKKIKIVTGKGNRSKVKENPYISADFSVLKNSIPEFIKNDKDMFSKIIKMYPASHEDGGEGAFYILLKKPKE